jgi:rhomboid protease GluP
VVLKETWLSRPARPGALDLTCLSVAALVLGSFTHFYGADLAASGAAVFGRHEWWRAWSALFAHADLGHLLSNVLLFAPFSWFLAGYTPRWFYPGLAFLAGGAANLAVLLTMDPGTELLGASGVVFWMGAAWLTLYLLVEKRDRLRVRAGKAILAASAVFLPDTVRAEVSYASHYLGFASGVACALLLYRLERARYRAAERREVQLIEDGIEEEEWTKTTESPPAD